MAEELNIQAIRQAQLGNTQSLAAVAEQVRAKVYTYVCRLTFDYHLAQDLARETVLEMITALSRLKISHVDGFWGWVLRTALGAMLAVKLKYRSILVLRCLDNPFYEQIAGIMGGSELRARLLFCRAKHSLKSKLEQHGFRCDPLPRRNLRIVLGWSRGPCDRDETRATDRRRGAPHFWVAPEEYLPESHR